jgi:4-hydroxymandelate oxidase
MARAYADDMDALQLEQRARAALSVPAYDYYAGGADDELTLADNVAAWSRYRLRPHTLRDVSQVSPVTTVLGTEVSLPLLVAPMAYQRMADDEGEAATARGAARAGTVMLTSTLATVSLEDVAAAAPEGPRWFQLYVHRDRGWTEDLVQRAEASGYRALVLTVDLPVLGHRPRDERNHFALPDGMDHANVPAHLPHVEGSDIAAYAARQLEPNLTPADIEWLRGLSGLPVLVKGVLRGDDARLAVEAGAAGVIVSNHGGRQLDTAIAGADALPDVVAAVGADVEVYVDGGIRRGTDVVKALALGARAALVGRPVLWGLAAGGEDGVVGVLEGLRAELARAMALCGTPTVADVTRDLVVPPAGQL